MSDPGLAIFATPKAFHGHIGMIQRNAIGSWMRVEPMPEIFLFGEQEGTAEIAAEMGVRHLPGIACNEFGTPLLSDLLERAQELTRATRLCYVNCDVILLPEFFDAVVSVSTRFPKFLCVAERLNIDVTAPLEFDGNWQKRFRDEVVSRGYAGHASAIDVFAFQRDVYTEVPPLVLGRAWFDQWLIKSARVRNIPVVDLSRVAKAIHQNHEYLHIEGGQRGAYWGEEALRNLAIYGGVPHVYTLLDVTHELMENGRIARVRFRRRKAALEEWFWKTVIAPTAGVRKKIGLRRKRAIQEDRTAKA